METGGSRRERGGKEWRMLGGAEEGRGEERLKKAEGRREGKGREERERKEGKEEAWGGRGGGGEWGAPGVQRGHPSPQGG